MSRKSGSYPFRVDQSGSTTSASVSGADRSFAASLSPSPAVVPRDAVVVTDCVAPSPNDTVIVSGTEIETEPALATTPPPALRVSTGPTVVELRASSTGFGAVLSRAE